MHVKLGIHSQSYLLSCLGLEHALLLGSSLPALLMRHLLLSARRSLRLRLVHLFRQPHGSLAHDLHSMQRTRSVPPTVTVAKICSALKVVLQVWPWPKPALTSSSYPIQGDARCREDH